MVITWAGSLRPAFGVLVVEVELVLCPPFRQMLNVVGSKVQLCPTGQRSSWEVFC